MKLPPKFRGLKRIELYEVVVAEGEGTNEDYVREVHYYLTSDGKIKFIEDPLQMKTKSNSDKLCIDGHRCIDCNDCPDKPTLADEIKPCKCPHCGLSLDEHDGSEFCPGGTEEFGGIRDVSFC